METRTGMGVLFMVVMGMYEGFGETPGVAPPETSVWDDAGEGAAVIGDGKMRRRETLSI